MFEPFTDLKSPVDVTNYPLAIAYEIAAYTRHKSRYSITMHNDASINTKLEEPIYSSESEPKQLSARSLTGKTTDLRQLVDHFILSTQDSTQNSLLPEIDAWKKIYGDTIEI